MIRAVAFAASVDESRPVLTGVSDPDGWKDNCDGSDRSFRLALYRTEVATPLEKKQLIIPASVLKDLLRVLSATKGQHESPCTCPPLAAARWC